MYIKKYYPNVNKTVSKNHKTRFCVIKIKIAQKKNAPRQVRTVDLQMTQLINYETDALPTELVKPLLILVFRHRNTDIRQVMEISLCIRYCCYCA